MNTQYKKVGLCADHAGFLGKEVVKRFLEEQGIEVVDFGTNSEESVDYPDYAHQLGQAIDKGELEMGFAVCGSSNGIAMALNKHPKVRAALAWEDEIVRLSRQHNNANVLALAGRFMSKEQLRHFTELFLTTDFEGGRHQKRVEKIPL